MSDPKQRGAPVKDPGALSRLAVLETVQFCELV